MPLLLLLCAAAFATQTVGIELQLDPALAPAHVCVLTAGSGPAQVLYREADTGLTSTDTPGAPSDAQVRARQAFQPLRAEAFAPSPPSPGDRPPPGDCLGDSTGACRARIVAPHEAELGYFLDPEGEGEITKKFYVACRANTQPAAMSAGRVLFLLLDGAPNPKRGSTRPAVEGVQLVGNAVSVTLSSKEHPVLIGAVLGGDYAPGSVHVVEENRLLLPVRPRCALARIQIPPATRRVVGQADEMLSFTLAGEAVPGGRCRAEPDSTGRIGAMLSASEQSSPTELLLEAVSVNSDTPYLRARGSLDPEGVTTLEPTEIAFLWRRHPSYPILRRANGTRTDICPTVRLDPAGLPCEGEPLSSSMGEACHYRCPAPAQGAFGTFALPASARFDDPSGTLGWELPLSYAGEILDGYVSAEARVVPLSFADWYPVAPRPCGHASGARLNRCTQRRARPLQFRPGLGVRHIELTTPTEEQRIAHLPGKEINHSPLDTNEPWVVRIPLAGAEEGDLYRIRVKGVHRDDVRLVELHEGRLDIPTPGQNRPAWSWGWSLAAGPEVRRSCFWPTDGGPLSCVRLRPTEDTIAATEEDPEGVVASFWQPGVSVQASLQFWPRPRTPNGRLARRLWWVEFPLLLTFSREGYRPIDATGEMTPRSDPVYAPALWMSLGPALEIAPLPNSLTAFSIGVGGGLLYLAPVGSDNATRLSLPRATWTMSLEPRIRLGDHASLGLLASLNPARLIGHQVLGTTKTDPVFGGGLRTVDFPGLNSHVALLVRVDEGNR